MGHHNRLLRNPPARKAEEVVRGQERKFGRLGLGATAIAFAFPVDGTADLREE